MSISTPNDELLTLGWREWIGLPEIGVPRIKAKLDTGARTSALHAFDIRSFLEHGHQKVEFKVHPLQRNKDPQIVCTADVIDHRTVTNSGGQKEQRWVIQTPLKIGTHTWPIEITLTSRNDMLFRMLLGRTAIEGRALIDPSRSYLVGTRKRRKNP